jgi:hypothetical protein
MTDESEAADILISAYRRLGLDDQLGQSVSTCTVKYTHVSAKIRRSCSWCAKDSNLAVEVSDTDMDAGVLQVISSFSRESTRSDPRLLVRLSFVPLLMFSLLALFAPVSCLALLLVGYGLIGALIGIFGLMVAPMLLIWGDRVKQVADQVFVERVMRAASLDEEHVRNLYSDFLVRISWMGMLLAVESWMLLCTLLALFFSGLF